MHLSNEQLTEPNSDDLAHLNVCNQCQQRLEVLQQLRTKLQQTNIIAPPISIDDSWQDFLVNQQVDQPKLNPSYNGENNKFWRYCSISLAASLLMMVSIFTDVFIPESNENELMVVLIEQNQLLQQQLAEMEVARGDYGQIIFLLTSQDQKIQEAYMERLSSKSKAKLWLERQEIIKQWLAHQSIPKLIKI